MISKCITTSPDTVGWILENSVRLPTEMGYFGKFKLPITSA